MNIFVSEMKNPSVEVIVDVLEQVSGGISDAEAILEEARGLGLASEADILTREDPDENPQAWACLVLQSQK